MINLTGFSQAAPTTKSIGPACPINLSPTWTSNSTIKSQSTYSFRVSKKKRMLHSNLNLRYTTVLPGPQILQIVVDRCFARRGRKRIVIVSEEQKMNNLITQLRG
jgi:hypothetical protein